MAEQWSRRNFCLALGTLSAGARLSRAEAGVVSLPFKLGVITDEIAEDLGQALDFIASYSLAYCELREMWGRNIMHLNPAELDRAKQLIERHRLKVSEIGSPIFKYHLPGMPSPHANMNDTFNAADLTDKGTENLLREVFKLARFFDTSKVRVFSYWRVEEPEEAFPHVRESLAKAAALAAQNKITLLLENEHECNVGTGKELGRMLREINSPYLRGMWDPCNAARLGEVPYPDGYRQVRGLFRHMHIKDIKKDPTTGELQRVPVGKGMIDFRGQFKALRDDGYDGTMSLETGYSRPDGNKVESTRECLEGLFRVLKSVNAKKSEVRSQKSEGLPRL
jgi:sugar phosphate isomerase/epimerase